MCPYWSLSAIGNYAFLSAPIAMILVSGFLLAAGVFSHNPVRNRAAQRAAIGLVVPLLIIPIAAVAIFITEMGHQVRCPGIFFHGTAAALGVLSLTTAVACPTILWMRAMQRVD